MIELLIFGFITAQGAAVFATAWLGLRLLKVSHWLGKIAAMAVSWLAWMTATVTAYVQLGGGGGLMDGGFLLLSFCATATASSMAYLVVWLLIGLFRRPTREG